MTPATTAPVPMNHATPFKGWPRQYASHSHTHTRFLLSAGTWNFFAKYFLFLKKFPGTWIFCKIFLHCKIIPPDQFGQAEMNKSTMLSTKKQYRIVLCGGSDPGVSYHLEQMFYICAEGYVKELVATLRKMTRDSRHSMRLGHPVMCVCAQRYVKEFPEM